jgi:hypothetical protein
LFEHNQEISAEYADQAPLPESFWIIRLAVPPKDYSGTQRVSAIQLNPAFQLSSADKQSVPPHLSVWAEKLTTPQQAYAFLCANRPDSLQKLVIRLSVEEITALRSRISSEQVINGLLDVIWIHLFVESENGRIRDTRPGADGHAGIVGLDGVAAPATLTNREKKNLRKDLRAQLAQLASRRSTLLKS